MAQQRTGLKLSSVFVDGLPVAIHPDGILHLGSGLHRLDFDFGFDRELVDGNVKLRCQLEGIDERWQHTDRGMSLICQALGAKDRVISQSQFPFAGRSSSWQTTLEDSEMTRRVEPLFIPPEATALRLTLASGSPDTSGLLAIDHLKFELPGGQRAPLWQMTELFARTRAAREPKVLPARPLGSEFRHHLALAVKEALHNIQKHAGACEMFLALDFDGKILTITVRDTGRGFDPGAHSVGHGVRSQAQADPPRRADDDGHGVR